MRRRGDRRRKKENWKREGRRVGKEESGRTKDWEREVGNTRGEDETGKEGSEGGVVRT